MKVENKVRLSLAGALLVGSVVGLGYVGAVNEYEYKQKFEDLELLMYGPVTVSEDDSNSGWRMVDNHSSGGWS